MAPSGGSPGPFAAAAAASGTEESGDQGPVPHKRTISRELAGGDDTDAVEKKRQRKTASPAEVGKGPSSAVSPAAPAINAPLLPSRYPPFPRHFYPEKDWELRIAKLAKKDPRRNLPTVMQPKDPETADNVISSRDKAIVREVARSIVCIIVVGHGDCTGIVVGWNKTRKCARILTEYRSFSGYNPQPRLDVRLPNKTVLEGKLLFVDEHYDIALLEISSESDLPLQLPSFGSNPNYGQEVFVLARDRESYLTARHGKILWLEKADYLGRNFHMFFSCEPPVVSSGGVVIDLDGNIIGMIFEDFIANYHIVAISTILTCIEMWTKFSRIAHPVHGLRLRTVELMEVSLQEVLYVEHNINSGYIVDEVSVGSTAERLGIRFGDVIISFEGLRDHTLPQLEDFLLSLGWKFLEGNTHTNSINVKLEVYDLLRRTARTIIFPVGFHDVRENYDDRDSSESDDAPGSPDLDDSPHSPEVL